MAENTENKGSKNEVDEQKLAGIFRNFWRDYGKDTDVEKWKSYKGGTEVIDYLKDPNKQPGAILRGCEEFYYCRNKYEQSNEKGSGEKSSDFQYDESQVPWQRLLDDSYINWCVSVFTWDDALLSKANQQGRHVVKENWGSLLDLDASIKITNLAKKHLGISDEKKDEKKDGKEDGKEENKKPENEEGETEKKVEEKPVEQTTEEQVNDPKVKGVVIMGEPTEAFIRVAKEVKNPEGDFIDPNKVQTSGNSQTKEGFVAKANNVLGAVCDAVDSSMDK